MTPFGTLADGREVHAVTLASDRLRVTLLDFGARLHEVTLDGGPNMIVSGKLADYEGPLIYAGPVIAPVVNRIAGARAEIDGRTLRLDANQHGQHTLHSGPTGTQAHVWSVAARGAAETVFAVDLPDGLGGFPGARRITATYAVDGATLRLEIAARTDRPTLMNPAIHGIWNLDGAGGWGGHLLTVASDRYLPVDDETLPTGEIAEVAGTAFDHRKPREPAPTLDHNFCLPPAEALRLLARLAAPAGRSMELISDAPGLQVFAGARGIALEPQLWPDAPRHPHFPSIRLNPGDTFRQTVLFRFAAP